MYKKYVVTKLRVALRNTKYVGKNINNFWCLTHNKNYIAHEKMPSRLNTDAACVTNTLHLIAATITDSQRHQETVVVL